MSSGKRSLAIAALALLTLAIALAAGSSGWHWPWSLDAMLLSLRGPRVIMAAIVGAALALAGAGMQALLRNDLADPYVLGLSGGASVGAVLSLALAPGIPPGAAAAVGAAGAATLTRMLARGPYDPARMLLVGVGVAAVLASLTGMILVLAPADRLLRSATFWLFGGFGTPSPRDLIVPAIVLAAAFAWMCTRAERLDRLSLGPEVAASLGVDVPSLRRGLLIVSVALTAIAVAVGGLIGFVGLVAPHAARRSIGAPHRQLLPTAAILGALLTVAADTFARAAFAPRELPVGLVTATVGGPLFLWQLRKLPR